MRTDTKLLSSFQAAAEWESSLGKERFVIPSGDGRYLSKSHSGHERNHLFLNRRGQDFSDISLISGLDSPADSRSFVLWDYNRDGWQDIAVINANAPLLALYRNELGPVCGKTTACDAPIIALRFVGGNRLARPSSSFAPRDGYGAMVLVSLGQQTLKREHRCGEGFAAQNSATMIIGIGGHKAAGSVVVRWPSGKTQKIENVPAGTLLTVYENPLDSSIDQAFVLEPYRIFPPGNTRPSKVVRSTKTPLILALEGAANSVPDATDRSGLRLYTTMATWCTACKKELPQLEHLRSVFAAHELKMFGVPVDPNDSPDKLNTYIDHYMPVYQLLVNLAPEGQSKVREILAKTLQTEALPCTIVTGASGLVLKTFTGVPTVSDLRKLLGSRTQPKT